MPWPGTTITVRAESRISAASSGVAEWTGRAVACAALVCSCPNAPNRMLLNDRFMARDMMIERINQEEPSSAPAIMRRLLSSTNPMALADSPAYELRSAMTVGISAPPIGMMSRNPNNSASVMKIGNIQVCSGEMTSATPTTTRSEEHTSELQSQSNLVCRLLLEKKKEKVLCEYD